MFCSIYPISYNNMILQILHMILHFTVVCLELHKSISRLSAVVVNDLATSIFSVLMSPLGQKMM